MLSCIAKETSPAARYEWMRLSREREAEVRYGMAKHALSRERADAIEGLLANLQILGWGSEEASAYARIRVQLERQGVTLSAMDLLIAAQAIAAGAVLITRDKVFAQVAELHGIVNWASDL